MDALPPLVAEHLGEVRALCEKYHVRKLTIFGSAVKGTFDPEKSDLDFVVDFEEDPDPLVMGGRWLGLWDDLRELFARHVDLLVASTIRSPYVLAQIDLAHLDLYAA
jgi:predicted nucleotidyltransferase